MFSISTSSLVIGSISLLFIGAIIGWFACYWQHVRTQQRISAQELVDSQKEQHRRSFYDWFQFYPELLVEHRYQKQCLVTMAALAKKVMAKHAAYSADPRGFHWVEYQEALKIWENARTRLRSVDPALEAQIPGWMDMDSFMMDRWAAENLGDVIDTTHTASDSPSS